MSNFCLLNKTVTTRGKRDNDGSQKAQRENTSFTVGMRVIFHINDILNDSLQKFLMQVYEKSYKHVYLTTRRSTSLTVQ